MNTIVVDYAEVEKSDKTTDFPFMHKFLFDRFKLIMKNVSDGEETINTIVNLHGDGTVSLQKYRSSEFPDENGDFEGKVYVDDYSKYHGDFCTSCSGGNYNRLSAIFESMKYIMANLEERETDVVAKDSPMRSSVCRKESNNKPQKVYLMDDIKRYFYISKPMNEKSISHIQCLCWSVRGHYRHYKSGKVIFVENYLKGKDREKIKPKDKEYFA